MAGFSFEFDQHFAQHDGKILDRYFAFVAIQYLHKARHVRALEVMGQANVHVEHGDGVLHAGRLVLDHDRVADGLDADLVDGYLARVRRILDVRDVCVRGVHGLFFNELLWVGLDAEFLLNRSYDANLVEAKFGQ